MEGYTTLGFLAAHTSTVSLGLLVTGVTYRHPGLLAKIVTTVDVLSGGARGPRHRRRLVRAEHQGLGVPFPPIAERFERLEEALQICEPDVGPREQRGVPGQALSARRDAVLPQPINKPKVMIGGGGERKTLRLVARYGDACNLFASSPDEVAHKLDVLRGHCDDAGRD